VARLGGEGTGRCKVKLLDAKSRSRFNMRTKYQGNRASRDSIVSVAASHLPYLDKFGRRNKLGEGLNR